MKKIIIYLVLLFFSSILKAQEIKSYNLQVTFNQTVHILFPAPIKYVDLGSLDLIAQKVEASENVLKIKAAIENFAETNMTVICSDGTFYSFKVTYTKTLTKLNITITNEIFTTNLGNVSTRQVEMIMKSIYQQNRFDIKYLGSKLFSVQMLVKSIYVHEDLYFIHIYIKNTSNIALNIDFVRFRVSDKKLVKRTAMQEIYIEPITTFNEQTRVNAHSSIRMVYVLPKFTIINDKILVIEMYEKDGARNQFIQIENQDFENAKTIENLKL